MVEYDDQKRLTVSHCNIYFPLLLLLIAAYTPNGGNSETKTIPVLLPNTFTTVFLTPFLFSITYSFPTHIVFCFIGIVCLEDGSSKWAKQKKS